MLSERCHMQRGMDCRTPIIGHRGKIKSTENVKFARAQELGETLTTKGILGR